MSGGARPVPRAVTAALLAALFTATAAVTFAAPVWGQPAGRGDGAEPELSIRPRPARAEIGDRIQVEVAVVVPAGLAVGQPLFPTWGETWGDVEVVAAAEPVAEPAAEGATVFRQTVTVTPWTTGEITLTSPVIEIPTASEILRVTSPRSAVIDVGSVLPEGEERPAPMPPAAPLALPIRERFWWTLAVAAAACLAAATLLWRRRAAREAAREAAVDPLTAFRQALAGLAGGDQAPLLIAGLSLALRRYLGGRLGFRAAESTTTEIRRRLQELSLPAGLVVGVDKLLKRCDAIKFARRPIARRECDGPLRDAARLADELEAHLRPPPAASEREAA